MFRIITGNLGSGKSYYAVNYLRKFCKFDRLYNTMILDHDVLLVTNVDDIRVNYMHFDDFVREGLLNATKTKEYLLEHNYKRMIFIVDEAQNFFSGCKNNEQLFWFEYSRHLGIDVFLIVQSIIALPKRITELCEYVVNANPRSYRMLGFSYSHIDPRNGIKLESVIMKTDPTVFKLYKSFDIEEDKKARPKKVILRKLVIAVAILVMAFGYMIYQAKSGSLFGHKKVDKNIEQVSQTPREKKKNTVQTETVSVTSKSSDNQQIATVKKKRFVKFSGSLSMKPHDDVTGVAHVGGETYVFYE